MNNREADSVPENKPVNRVPEDLTKKAEKYNQRTIANNYSRCVEPSKSLGAGAHAAYCIKSFDDASLGNETVTADILTANAIGNGAGLVMGILLHYMLKKYYRLGSHEIFWLDENEIESSIKAQKSKSKSNLDEIEAEEIEKAARQLKIKTDGAYIRYKNRLYYVNNIIKSKATQLDINADYFEENFSRFYENIKPGDSRALASGEALLIAKKIKEEDPEYIDNNGRTSTNPLYRNFKNLSALGFQFGQAANAVSNISGLENSGARRIFSFIFSDICCIIFGLFAFAYWLVREKILGIPANSKHEYAITGTEGWSKYAKTSLTFGTSVGQAIAGVVAATVHHASAAMVSFSISLWGGLMGVAGFFFGLFVVPLVNWVTSKFSKDRRGYFSAEVWDLGLVKADTISEEELHAISAQSNNAALIVNEQNEYYIFCCHRNKWQKIKLQQAGFTEEEINKLKNLPFNKIGKIFNSLLLTKNSPELTREIITTIQDKKVGNKPLHIPHHDKDKFRNNYPRSGMVLGAGVGAIIGLGLGYLFFGPILCSIIISAIGSAIGAIALSIYGKDIHKKLHPPGEVSDPENSWDYVSRSSANVFAFIGAAVVCVINPAAALLLAPIGTAIAGFIGWGLGLIAMRRIRHVREKRIDPETGQAIIHDYKKEEQASSLPWTQRITTGANVGAAIGGVIGFAVGCVGFVFSGPAGMILAVSLFGALGAIVGGVAGVLYDANGRKAVWAGIKSFFVKSEDLNDISKRKKLPPEMPLTTSKKIGPDDNSSLSTTAKIIKQNGDTDTPSSPSPANQVSIQPINLPNSGSSSKPNFFNSTHSSVLQSDGTQPNGEPNSLTVK
ncbi:MAG TPA: hypothetical protein VHA13_05830 [Gammaproteobacteria bacterium]|nr:hypothetical protein [Gammaproteobacteria bacterium]